MNVYLYLFFTNYGRHKEDFNARFVTESVHKFVHGPFPENTRDSQRERLPLEVIEALPHPDSYGETYSEDLNEITTTVGSFENDRALSCEQIIAGTLARFKTVTEAFAFAEENGLCIIGEEHWYIY
jgi:hypothetical protein